MNRYKFSKIINNSLILLSFSYALLVLFSRGFLDTTYQGINVVNLLFVIIITPFLGIAWSAYNFSLDSAKVWEFGKHLAISLLVSSILLIAGIILFSIEEAVKSATIHVLAFVLMILAYIALIFYGAFFYKQLVILHNEDYIIKRPNYYLITGFAAITLAYLLFFLSFLVPSETLKSIINIIGIISGALGSLLVIISNINISISFKTYAHLIENKELRKNNGKREK